MVLDGVPDLGTGTMSERLAVMREGHDALRAAMVSEPRGSDVLVGALLCTPVNPDNAAGVIFFNNVGYLGMCGHGAIGIVFLAVQKLATDVAGHDHHAVTEVHRPPMAVSQAAVVQHL